MSEELKITQEWDKVFPKSEKVNHRKITFKNHFGITIVADMYEPKEYEGLLPAIAVSGPYGAVKEQSSGLYAQEMAERGFLTIAFDPSFKGNQISLFYNSNSWSYTKLGKIQNISSSELKNILGNGDVTITFTLSR